MFKIAEVGIFIYQTKHIEVPRFITVEPVDKKGLTLVKYSIFFYINFFVN